MEGSGKIKKKKIQDPVLPEQNSWTRVKAIVRMLNKIANEKTDS